MTFCLFSPDGFTRASFEQRICKAVAQKKACNSARVLQIHEVPVTVVDWSNVNFHIHDDCCLFVILRCLPSEYDARCFPLHQKNRILPLKKKWRRRLAKRNSVDTHFCLWLVSVSLHSTFEGNTVQPQIPVPSHSHSTTCPCPLHFVLTNYTTTVGL